MPKIETWKKIISIVGFLTLEIGHTINSKILIITGGISIMIGLTLILTIK